MPYLTDKIEIKWRKAFMEIVLRAFRKLHIEYGMWGLGQASEKTVDFKKLNVGPGAELALETTVCSAISLEFINSPFTNGAYIDEKDNEPRRYEIDREVRIKKQLIDILIIRYKTGIKGIEYYKYPSIIEAKRAQYFNPKITTGEKGNFHLNIEKLKRDKNKLIKIRDLITVKKDNFLLPRYNNINDAFLNLLFWGITTENEIDWKKKPNEYIKKIGLNNSNSGNLEIRWMPLNWDELPKINEWLWIVLIEINPLPSQGLDFQNWFQIDNENAV